MNDLIIKWYNWLKTKQWSVETWIINLLGMGSDFRLIQLLALIPVTYTPSMNLLSSLKRTRCQRSICQIPRATPAACWGHLRGSGSAPHASPRTEEQMGVLLLGCCPPAPPPTSAGVLACLLVLLTLCWVTQQTVLRCVWTCHPEPPVLQELLKNATLVVRLIYTRIYSSHCFQTEQVDIPEAWFTRSYPVMIIWFCLYSFNFPLRCSCWWAKPSSLTCLMSLITPAQA